MAYNSCKCIPFCQCLLGLKRREMSITNNIHDYSTNACICTHTHTHTCTMTLLSSSCLATSLSLEASSSYCNSDILSCAFLGNTGGQHLAQSIKSVFWFNG